MKIPVHPRIAALVTLCALAAFAVPAAASEREEALSRLEAAAADLPRGIAGIPAQWFEMNSAIGWEKMMLVFGYADNRTTCNNMIELAYAENNQRDFRCTPAN